MSYGDVMVIEIILKHDSKCLVLSILTFFPGGETKTQISATGSHHFRNIHIPRKWIVVSARADWLTRRWLARYYSPRLLQIIFKFLAASVFHAPTLLLIMDFAIIFFKVAVYPWGIKNWRQFLFLQLTRLSLSKSVSEMFERKRSRNVRHHKLQTTFNNSKTECRDGSYVARPSDRVHRYMGILI